MRCVWLLCNPEQYCHQHQGAPVLKNAIQCLNGLFPTHTSRRYNCFPSPLSSKSPWGWLLEQHQGSHLFPHVGEGGTRLHQAALIQWNFMICVLLSSIYGREKHCVWQKVKEKCSLTLKITSFSFNYTGRKWLRSITTSFLSHKTNKISYGSIQSLPSVTLQGKTQLEKNFSFFSSCNFSWLRGKISSRAVKVSERWLLIFF